MDSQVPRRRGFAVTILIIEIILIVLFAIFAKYDEHAQPRFHEGGNEDSDLHPSYAMFQDIHIMIFIGFGFLMTFLKRYGYGAVGINFLLAAFALQWAIIMQGILHSHGRAFSIGITTIIEGDIAAAAVLITFGAMLGKASPLQLVIVATVEIVFFAVNFHIGVHALGAVDAGGSMFVHTFGAYFGIACAWITFKDWHNYHKLASSNYHSDMFSLVGTIFLWICWPSFNAALVPDNQQYRAVINTYLALAACVLSSFAISVLVSKKAKLDIIHVQNATLAGGVAIGTAADFVVSPFGAMVVGLLAGALSVVGYRYFTPWLSARGIHDTCGVNNLHGMPGVFAGIIGIIATAFASSGLYGKDLHAVFPRTAPIPIPSNGTGEILYMEGRSMGKQAGMQAAALIVTLVLATIGGMITGLCLKWKLFIHLKEWDGYADDFFFELPEDDEMLSQQTADTNQTVIVPVSEEDQPVRNDFSPSPDFQSRLPKEQKKPQTTTPSGGPQTKPQTDQQAKPIVALNPASRHDIFQ